MISLSSVPYGDNLYQVVFPNDTTLELGDVIKICDYLGVNIALRLRDLTLHAIKSRLMGQYAIVTPWKESLHVPIQRSPASD